MLKSGTGFVPNRFDAREVTLPRRVRRAKAPLARGAVGEQAVARGQSAALLQQLRHDAERDDLGFLAVDVFHADRAGHACYHF